MVSVRWFLPRLFLIYVIAALVIYHFLINQFLPLFYSVFTLVDAVIVRTGWRLKREITIVSGVRMIEKLRFVSLVIIKRPSNPRFSIESSRSWVCSFLLLYSLRWLHSRRTTRKCSCAGALGRRKCDVQDLRLAFCWVSRALVMPSNDCARWSRSGKERRGTNGRRNNPGSAADSLRNFAPSAADAAWMTVMVCRVAL